MNKIHIISGLSGTGKTTLGKAFVNNKNILKNFNGNTQPEKWTFIDQDSFYLKEKPLIKLSDGRLVKNWDCEEAIDWKTLNENVIEQSKKSNIILVGFALFSDKLTFLVDSHTHLYYNTIYKEEIINRCCESRKISKKFDENQCLKDKIVVEEVVYPFYCNNFDRLNITNNINLYDDGNRISIEELLKLFSFYNLKM